MTVDELLKPRYKCIAQYPDSPYDVGQIMCITNKDGHMIYMWSDSKGDYEKYEIFFKEYPHLFKPLQFYHDRTREEIELVEYVKWAESQKGIIGKVIEWRQGHLGWECRVKDYPGAWNPSESSLLIATKEEYDTYIKTLKQ